MGWVLHHKMDTLRRLKRKILDEDFLTFLDNDFCTFFGHYLNSLILLMVHLFMSVFLKDFIHRVVLVYQ